MVYFTDNELLELLNDDLPYLDLSTYLQEKSKVKARLDIFTREDIIVSCSEEASRIAKLMNCEIAECLASKTYAKRGSKIVSFIGDYENLHKIWRTSQLILEYSSKIATYTYEMKQRISEVNPSCELLSTRKTYPFAKKFCIKSVLIGGAFIHRLNLSETLLFFPNHRIVYKDNLEFYRELEKFKVKMPEKKLVVERSSFYDAKELLNYGVDVLQLDKMPLEEIREIIKIRNKSFKDRKILASGGINLQNAKDYAQSGIDAIVTSSVYSCGMSNLGSKISLL